MATRILPKKNLIEAIAQRAQTSSDTAEAVLAAFSELAREQLSVGGPGAVVLPDVARFTSTYRAATPDRPGINPFTREAMTIGGRPATWRFKAKLLPAFQKSIPWPEATSAKASTDDEGAAYDDLGPDEA